MKTFYSLLITCIISLQLSAQLNCIVCDTSTTSSAEGVGSIAGGDSCNASGQASTVFGSGNNATGHYSFAAGYQNMAGGNSSAAFGAANTASAPYSFTTGTGNVAEGSNSVALGQNATSSGTNTITLGQNISATGRNSMTIGLGTSPSTPLVNRQDYSLLMGFTQPFMIVRANDSTPGQLGLGTTNPKGLLHVTGSKKSSALVVSPEGYVGFGTASPKNNIEVHGTMEIVTGANGALKIVTGEEGDGKILQSNSSGKVTWGQFKAAYPLSGMGTGTDSLRLDTPTNAKDELLKFVNGEWTFGKDNNTTYKAGKGLTVNKDTFNLNPKFFSSGPGIAIQTDNDSVSISSSLEAAYPILGTGITKDSFRLDTPTNAKDELLKFINGEWTFGKDNNTTYSAGNGLLASQDVFSLDKSIFCGMGGTTVTAKSDSLIIASKESSIFFLGDINDTSEFGTNNDYFLDTSTSILWHNVNGLWEDVYNLTYLPNPGPNPEDRPTIYLGPTSDNGYPPSNIGDEGDLWLVVGGALPFFVGAWFVSTGGGGWSKGGDLERPSSPGNPENPNPETEDPCNCPNLMSQMNQLEDLADQAADKAQESLDSLSNKMKSGVQGDVNGSLDQTTVTGLQNNPVSNATPNSKDVLTFVSGQWVPQRPSITKVGTGLEYEDDSTELVVDFDSAMWNANKIMGFPIDTMPKLDTGQYLIYDGLSWKAQMPQYDVKGVWDSTSTDSVALIYAINSHVGIGTNEPQYLFQVQGDTIGLPDPDSTVFVIGDNGNVGIGTTRIDTVYKLSVKGGVRAVSITVESEWADHVFEDDYDLMPLEDVETFIEDNGHLPGIPSARSIENEGLDLGATQRLMMEKIEELTLYLLELKADNARLEAELNALRSH